MANYDVNIAVRAVTKKAEQALKKIEGQVAKIRKSTKQGIQWGRSASLGRAIKDLGKLGEAAQKAASSVRGIGERAGFGLLILGAAKAARSLQEATRNTTSFGRAIEFINKATGTSPFKALVEGTTRLTAGFKNLVPGGNKAAAVISATGEAAKKASSGIAGALISINSLPTVIKAAGIAVAAFGPQLPVLASALGDVAGAADRFFGKVPSTQFEKLGKAIRNGLNKPVEMAVGRFLKLEETAVRFNKNLMALGYQFHIQKNSLAALNAEVAHYRSTLESTHSSEQISIQNAKNYATALKFQRKEQRALNDLVRQYSGDSGRQRATNRWNTLERRSRIARGGMTVSVTGDTQHMGGRWSRRTTTEHDLRTAKSVRDIQQQRAQKEKMITDEVRKRWQLARLEQQVNASEEQRAAKRASREKMWKRGKDMASSGLIGGGFPLLFGQGGAAAVGGGIGGLIGGAMGGGFGFGVSVVGTAIGQAVQNSRDFTKALKTLNSQLSSVGGTASFTKDEIKRLAKQMGVAKEEAMEFAAEYARFGKDLTLNVGKALGEDKQLKTAMERIAVIRDEATALEALSAMKTKLSTDRITEINDLIKQNKLEKARILLFEDVINARREVLRTEAKAKGVDMSKFSLEEVVTGRYGYGTAVGGGHSGRGKARTLKKGLGEDLKALNIFMKENFPKLQKLLTEEALVFDTSAAEKLSSLTKGITDDLKKGNETILSFEGAIKDRVHYENEYAEAIRNGSTPAQARQLVELQKQEKAYDKLIDKQIEATELSLKEARAELIKLEGVKGRVDEYDKLIVKIKEAEDALKGWKDKKEKGTGQKPKTPGDTIQDEITRIQGALNDLMDPAKRLITIANGVGNAFAESFKGIANGSMTAREALANFTQRIADMFLEMAAQIAANRIALTILSAFAPTKDLGLGANDIPSSANIAADGAYWKGGFKAFNQGGFVNEPTLGLVGEGGEAEYIIPESKMNDAMDRYAGGARGDDVLAGGGETGGEGGAGGASSGVIDVTFNTQVINDVSYVSYSEFEAGVTSAAQQGAKMGELSTLKKLRNSPSTRRRVGV